MYTILAIEAEPLVVQQIRDTLTEADNFAVNIAQEAATGIELAHSLAPSLILCNMQLSDPDSYAVLRRLRRDPETAHIPFIFLTHHITWEAIRHGMDLGADDCLIKPFLPETLVAAVEARLQRYSAITANAERGLDRAKRRLMQMVTHELRTPLVPISMAVEIVSRQLGHLEPAQLEELLETIGTSSRRLSRLIEQMVFVTQLEAGVLRKEDIQKNGFILPLGDILLVAIDLARRFAYRHPDVSVHLGDFCNSPRCDTRSHQRVR
jgi:DNA-binding response OmpR family regulator